MRHLSILFAILFLVFFSTILMAQVPKLINYQGVLLDDNNQPVNDTLKITFTIYEKNGTTLLWTEEHSQVKVENGLFHVILGSTAPFDIPFDKPYELGIKVNNDPELSPRMELTSTAYSINADKVKGSGNIFPGNGNVGIGTTNPQNKLEVNGVIQSTQGGFKFPDGTMMNSASTDGDNLGNHTATQNINLNGNWLSGDGDNEGIFINSGGNIGIGIKDAGNAKIKSIQTGLDKAGFFQVRNPENNSQALLTNTNGKGLAFYASSYGTGRAATIGINNPENSSNALEVGTNGKGSALLIETTNPENSSNALVVKTKGNQGCAIEGVAESTTGITFGGYFSSATTLGAGVYGESSGGMASGVKGFSTGLAGQGIYGLAEGDKGFGGYFESRKGTGIYAKGASGKPAAEFEGNVKCEVLTITGGSDIAEPFDISQEMEIKPGMVMSIDAKNPGQLKVADKEYDRGVAGIVSGAGGIAPGMIMGQEGSIANGDHAIALSGRVYCLVDASNGSIKPVDLLTTSDTRGHAMKVTDLTRAQGAILGKAMSSLEKGQGLVLMLVTLQ